VLACFLVQDPSVLEGGSPKGNHEQPSVRKQKRSLKSDFTSVVVLVTQRTEPNLTKVFPQTSIDWAVIENQLVAWSELYRAGKKLRLNLSFSLAIMVLVPRQNVGQH
jgi:hypothetical protein